ncbi:IS66 family transposase [Dysgonomonas termitidis]|uniref:Transposase n=1 Tax=Dysgonomonas termitidis TaxID=1516126 RepID=A0ABV9KQV4_9BACT
MEGLPVVEVIIEPENLDRNRYVRIGEEHTKTLEFEPGKLYVKDRIRPRYALKDKLELPREGEKTVVIAPLPLLPLYKCMFGSTLAAELLIQKYTYHIPFHRQLRQLKDLGVILSESTVNGCFSRLGEALRPLYGRVREIVLSSGYIQADETVLPVISKDKHKAEKEYLWVARSVLDRMHFFHYELGDRKYSVNPVKCVKNIHLCM